MTRRNPRPRGLRAGSLSVVALTAALAGTIAPPVSHAQPAPAPAPNAAPAPGRPDNLERAKDLYRSAEAAMKDGRFDDAARDYGAAYELSRDPALFFKIGHANERGGKCDIALIYYARYLRDGSPPEPFVQLTRERIAACGGSAPGPGPGSATAPSPGSQPRSTAPASPGGEPPGAGRPAPGGAAATAPRPTPGGTGSTGSTAPEAPPPTPGRAARAARAAPADAGSGSSTPAVSSGPAAPPLIPPTRQKVAWLMGGSALALVALGGVLAYAASSSENDVRDLYAGFAGQTPTFDAQTRQRYNDLVDEGQRYQHLSWAAFGVAGAAAIGTAVLFAIGGNEPARAERPPAVTPMVTPHSAGVSLRF